MEIAHGNECRIIVPMFFDVAQQVGGVGDRRMLVGGFLVEAEIPDRVNCRKETQHAGLRQPIAESADRFGFLKQPAAFPAVEAGMRYKPPDGYSAFMAFACRILVRGVVEVLERRGQYLDVIFIPQSFCKHPAMHFRSAVDAGSVAHVDKCYFFSWVYISLKRLSHWLPMFSRSYLREASSARVRIRS